MNESKMDAKAAEKLNSAKAEMLSHDFVETAFTNEQVDAAIFAEERAGIRNGKCAFLEGPVRSPGDAR